MIATQQMELGMENKTNLCPSRNRQRRMPGARWWFDQMHRTVEAAPDWESSKLSEIRQASFAFPGRHK